ncbi:hypothetical protein OSG_eHP25_00120 [environmental Halophage eHP-25]|nr:hypothetical protein OSG_eHP25_00120 [environmental Halophage eHP-25]
MRYFCIVNTSALATAESAAIEWDAEGNGAGTFEQGAPLSGDGGASVTHRACNTLGGPIDVQYLLDTFVSVSAMDVYRCDDDLGDGLVERADVLGADAYEWAEIGTGDLPDLALQDAGMQVYQTETVGGVPEWEPGVEYAVDDQASYEGTVYVCIQAHTSQDGWEPPNPALWDVV